MLYLTSPFIYDCCEVKCYGCYDADLDPKGENYDGCVNTTLSGRTCQVIFIENVEGGNNLLLGLGINYPTLS